MRETRHPRASSLSNTLTSEASNPLTIEASDRRVYLLPLSLTPLRGTGFLPEGFPVCACEGPGVRDTGDLEGVGYLWRCQHDMVAWGEGVDVFGHDDRILNDNKQSVAMRDC